MDRIQVVLPVAAVVGCGIIAGLFFTWSNAVIPGMSRAGADAAVPVMVAANETIKNVWFGLVFAGTPILLVAAAVSAFVRDRPVAGVLLVIASAAYVLGVLVVTGAVNLPLNDALVAAAGDPVAAWADFVDRWQLWNRVRAASALVACACAAAALTQLT